LRGRARRVRPRIRRRFAMRKIMLIKIDYQAKSIRITLKLGEYPSIPWRSTWFEHRVRGWAVGGAIIFDDRVVIPFKALRRSMLGGLLDGIATRLLLDGYELSIGFIHVDLRPLQSIKIVYKRKKAIAQSKG